jgi:uncharacterized protein (DUF952 family)
VRIFHVATLADWTAAQAAGRYTTSTRGRTLAEEGFIHASRADQWQGVRNRFYADVTEPLVLLVIETDLLSAPVVEEHVGDDDGEETFPHVYGAIEPAAVTRVLPLADLATGADRVNAHPAPNPTRTPRQVAARLAEQSAVDRPGGAPQRSVFSYFVEEMGVRAGLGLCVLVTAVALSALALAVSGPVAALVTILVALVVGGGLVVLLLRRREDRLDEASTDV